MNRIIKTKIGEKFIFSDEELLNTFYSEKNHYIPIIKNIIKRKETLSDSIDIFTDALIILKEKYFSKTKDYVELRKILFGICKISAFNFLSRVINEVGYTFDNEKDDLQDIQGVGVTPYRLWYREYHKKYREKNRERIRERDRSPEVKQKRRNRDQKKRLLSKQ